MFHPVHNRKKLWPVINDYIHWQKGVMMCICFVEIQYFLNSCNTATLTSCNLTVTIHVLLC